MRAPIGVSFCILFTCACAQPPRTGAQTFTRHDLAVGGGATAILAPDINGDGHLDLLVANQEDATVSVLLGDGTGAVRTHQTVAAGPDPTGFAVGDLDRDGRLDLVIANHETQYLTLLAGDGRGGFAPASHSPLTVPVDPHPHVVLAHDLNRDGRVEILVDHRTDGGVLILPGIAGGFGPARFVPVGGDPYLGILLADVNGDGALDLVTPNPNAVGITLGGEGLSFAPPRELPVSRPFAIALSDLTGDGHPDLLAGSEGSGEIRWYAGDGAGAFGPRPAGTVSHATGAKRIVAGDFNGDGVGDAAVAAFTAREVLILFGGPESVTTHSVDVGENPWGLAAADLNADGRDDLAVTDYATGRLSIFVSAPNP